MNEKNAPINKMSVFLRLGLYFSLGYLIYNSKTISHIIENNSPLIVDNGDAPNYEYYASTSYLRPSKSALLFPKIPIDRKISDQELSNELSKSWNNFGGNILHLNYMNHYYTFSEDLMATNPIPMKEALKVPDIYGNTPVHLLMGIGGPERIIQMAMTYDNIMMANNAGETLLMLSARGESPQITQAILNTIEENGGDVCQELGKRDSKDRTASDWAAMTKEELLERFEKLSIDGTKDKEYRTNSFFYNNRYNYIAVPSFPEQNRAIYNEIGLEIGTSNWNEINYVSIKATKKKCRKITFYCK